MNPVPYTETTPQEAVSEGDSLPGALSGGGEVLEGAAGE